MQRPDKMVWCSGVCITMQHEQQRRERGCTPACNPHHVPSKRLSYGGVSSSSFWPDAPARAQARRLVGWCWCHAAFTRRSHHCVIRYVNSKKTHATTQSHVALGMGRALFRLPEQMCEFWPHAVQRSVRKEQMTSTTHKEPTGNRPSRLRPRPASRLCRRR